MRQLVSPVTGLSGANMQLLVKYINEYVKYNFVGSGTPENNIEAPIGSIYHRTDGGAGTSLYVKESGTGDTGWVGK